jgi:Putative auto-transporter adhesin, head GIN domain
MLLNRFGVLGLAVAVLGASGCKSFGVFNRGQAAQPTLAGFNGVQVGPGLNADISVGGDFAVTIDGDRALVRQVLARVENETLVVTRTSGGAPTDPIQVRVVLPKLDRLQVDGARVNVAAAAGPRLDITARDHSMVTATALDAGRLVLTASDASRVVLAGAAQTLEASLSGGSRGDARQLSLRNARVDLGQASRLDLRPERAVSGKATGGSRLAVWSKPKRVGVATRDASDVAYVR